MTVRRVFGEAYDVDGITVIPTAAVRGAGGGGEGEDPHNASTGSGRGMGFAIAARPIGAYVVDDGKVTWRPTIDVTRLALAAEILSFAATVLLGWRWLSKSS